MANLFRFVFEKLATNQVAEKPPWITSGMRSLSVKELVVT